MSSWEEAAARAFADEARTTPSAMPSMVVPPPPSPSPSSDPIPPPEPGEPVPLVVLDHFDLTMVDVPTTGARILVRQIRRLDAMELVRKHNPQIMSFEDRVQRAHAAFERELQLDAMPRPQLRYGSKLLVMMTPKWNDIRWFLVEWECDGDGCIP